MLWLMCFGLVFLRSVRSQSCNAPDKRTDDPFPDIWSLSKNNYQLHFEANFAEQRLTRFLTETYDKTNQRGRLDVEIQGKETRIVYFGKTNEIFEATRSSCASSLLSDLNEGDFAQKYGGWNWINKDEKIVGPSNMFRRALKEWNTKDSKIGKEAATETVRGMTTNVWTWCYNKDGNQVTNKFYFTDPKEENPYGLEGAIPIRITAEGTWNQNRISVSFEYIGMKLDLPQKELVATITIPVSVGCQRQVNITDLPRAPDYSKTDIYLEAEIVYTPIFNNTPGYTYVTNYKIAVNQKTGVGGVQFSPWKSHKDADMAEPGDNLYRIWDATNGFLFNMDKVRGTCEVSEIKDSFTIITLPDGSKIDLKNSDIFPVGTDGKDLVYMQEAVERGIPASIFEKRVDDFTSQFIVTRYHAANGTILNNAFKEKNAPLKVTYWMLNLDPGTFKGRLSVNFFAFQSGLQKLQEMFDVTDCFTLNSQSKWFQIVFPISPYTRDQVLPYLPAVVNDYPVVLEHFSTLVVPYRLPKLLVDVDDDNIYLNGFLLDRPDYLLDFKKIESSRLKISVASQTVVENTSLQDCAKKCIDQDNCTYFSSCGTTCTTTSSAGNVNTSDNVESFVGCTLYENKLTANSPTMDKVSGDIEKAVQAGNVTLMFANPEGTNVMAFKATQFKNNVPR